ncbi:MAG: RluA family pseudouridine synthase [Candidatus Pristimantibacillus lignocellulolyticus]|uniref:Pseudouridine synthase n=1 Tax=Candidatus Pristimantibacillus lignocellulolyticus TaxID=2994561 RepID=A0A9J6ZAC0_9BACL|nr:MAG: RluA family pseudouridine synthase [Candidatus Pristimantibacillus lignocellulolyticus]
MTTPRWSGRVVKHLTDDAAPSVVYGTTENMELLEQYYAPLTVVVSEEEAGKTVRDVLGKYYNVSGKLLGQARLTEHGLTINEERVYVSAPVQRGEIVRLRMLREESTDILPQQMPLGIIYEDDYLLIVNKPAGIVVHPTHGHYTNTLANGVVHYWKSKGERYRFRPIHRLDEETSGIVAIAKNGYIHQQLSEQMQQDDFDKQYIAFVYGRPSPETALIDAPIDRDTEQPHLRVVCSDGCGYPSQTQYTVLESFQMLPALSGSLDDDNNQSDVVSLVRLKLFTGRTHQIRVHMSSVGHPLIGDKFYYNSSMQQEKIEQLITRHALHAEKLAFTHPITKQYMEWTAPMPADFEPFNTMMRKGEVI